MKSNKSDLNILKKSGIIIVDTCKEDFKMTIGIKKWGNSLAIRLNQKLVNKYNLFENEKLDVIECEDGIKFKPKTDLDEILETVKTKPESYWENIAPEGNEIL